MVPWLQENTTKRWMWQGWNLQCRTCLCYWKIKHQIESAYLRFDQLFWSQMQSKHVPVFMVSREVMKCHLNTFELEILRYHHLHSSEFEVIKIFGKSSFIRDFNRRKTPPFLYCVREWTLRSRRLFFKGIPKQPKFTQDEPLQVTNEVPHLNDPNIMAF